MYNVAFGERTTLNELFSLIRERVANRMPSAATAEPVYRDFRAGDVRHSLADIGKANRLLGYDYYGWTTVSADGEAVIASNGLPIKIDYSVADIPPVDILFVAVGLTTEFPGKSKVLAALRSWGRRGGALGALSVGSYLLAEAGQLDGYRCTIHWENRAGFMERFPDINCTGNVFEIDR